MPYEIRETCVVNADTGDIIKCHETVEDAEAHLTALRLNAPEELKAVPEKYVHIDFTPSNAMIDEAERGLAWRNEYGRGGTDIGIARARDIANDVRLSPETVRRMASFFARHEIDKQGEGFSPGDVGYPSAGRIAWALWGGDVGRSWADARVRQMDAADTEAAKATFKNTWCAMLEFPGDPFVRQMQDSLRGLLENNPAFSGIRFIDPEKYHLTMVYGEGDLSEAQESLPINPGAFSILVDGVGVFHTPDDEYAIYARVRREGAITGVQAALSMSMAEAGIAVSEFHTVENFTPHITLAYSPEPITPFTLSKPVALAADKIALYGPDEQPVIQQAMKTMTDTKTYFIAGEAMKAFEDGRIGGYLVVWGSTNRKDLQGEYFTPDTDLKLDWFNTRPVLYQHGLDDHVGVTEVGIITSVKQDDHGIYAEAILDINHEDPVKRRYARQVYNLVKKGILGWSSGSMPHLVKVDRDGRITQWPLIEGSLTPTPAEPRRTSVQAIKMLITALEASTEPIEAEGQGVDRVPVRVPGRSVVQPGARIKPSNQLSTIGLKTMNVTELRASLTEKGFSPEQILDVLELTATAGEMHEDTEDMMEEDTTVETSDVPNPDAEKMDGTETEVMTPDQQRKTAGQDYLTAKNAGPIIQREIRAALKAHMRTAPGETPDVPPVRSDGKKSAPRIEVISKYRNLSPQDAAFLRATRNAYMVQQGQVYVDPELNGHMIEAAQKAIKSNGLKVEPHTANRIAALKTDDLNNITNAADGGNWTVDLISADLWERMRVDNNIASSFQIVEMPSDTYDLPVESTDPVVYKVPETKNENMLALNDGNNPTPDSKIVTAKATLQAVKMGVRSGFSSEIMEDSVIQFIPQLRAQQLRSLQDAIDNALGNGDTATGSGNINKKGGTVNSTDQDKWFVFNGLRKLALVTNTALGVDLNGAAPTLDKIRQARFKLLNAYAVRPQDLVYFVDVQTYGKMLNIDEILVYMNNGQSSSVNSGLIPMIDGSPVYPSAELGLTDTDGYVSTTGGDNTKGQMLIVHKPSWKVGYRRQITSNVTYIPYYDAYQMTMNTRIAFINRDNNCASILYNIGV